MRESLNFAMPLEEAITTQRAVRRLKPDPVPDALVLRLIELALKAPTGSNAQSWEWIVVRDPAVKAKLARQNRRAFRIYGALGRRATRTTRRCRACSTPCSGRRITSRRSRWSSSRACAGRGSAFPNVAATSYYGSIFPSVQNLLLAARAVGLGAALITLPLWSTFAARRILGLPWSVTPCAVIPLGWPVGRYGPTTRRPVGEVVSLDRYGNRPWQAR